MGLISLDSDRATRLIQNQLHWRTSNKYQLIGQCCTHIIALTVMITVVAGFIFAALYLIPPIFWITGSMPAKISVFAICSFVAWAGGIAMGFFSYMLTPPLRASVAGFLTNRAVRKADQALSGLVPGQSINSAQLVKLIKVADNICLKKLMEHMDFRQLCAARKVIGDRKFEQLIVYINTPGVRIHNQIRCINSLEIGIVGKIQRLDNEARHDRGYPIVKAAILRRLRECGYVDSFVYWVRKWSGVEEPLDKIAHDAFPSEEESLDPETIIDLQLRINVQTKDKRQSIALKTVSKAFLERESRYFNNLLKVDPNWEKDPILQIDDPHLFKQVFDVVCFGDKNLLTSEAIRFDWHPWNERLGRIFACTYKYWDRVAATLQLALTDKEFDCFVTDPQAKKVYLETRILA